jgi:putative methionine-R-sulfoxide reductase with GAF domain
MDLYSILGQQLSVEDILPPETAPAAAVRTTGAQPSGAEPMLQGNEWLEDRRTERPKPSSEEYALALRLLAESKLHTFLAAAVERLRYITNATGVALALCENEDDAMVCHASSGPAAPEKGARMYIRSGITAESLRTRQTLRCDRASTDSRVNQESCKALGIESVLVMPVIINGLVVGMFQLFGARPQAFSERDAIALRTALPQILTSLRDAADAGMPLGSIPWAEPPALLAPEAAPEVLPGRHAADAQSSSVPYTEEGGSITERVPASFPDAFPIDSYRKHELNPPQSYSEDAPKEDQAVPAFLARLADEVHPAANRTWSQWFRPQW